MINIVGWKSCCVEIGWSQTDWSPRNLKVYFVHLIKVVNAHNNFSFVTYTCVLFVSSFCNFNVQNSEYHIISHCWLFTCYFLVIINFCLLDCLLFFVNFTITFINFVSLTTVQCMNPVLECNVLDFLYKRHWLYNHILAKSVVEFC